MDQAMQHQVNQMSDQMKAMEKRILELEKMHSNMLHRVSICENRR